MVLDAEVKAKLLAMSAATADRRLAPGRRRSHIEGRSGGQAGQPAEGAGPHPHLRRLGRHQARSRPSRPGRPRRGVGGGRALPGPHPGRRWPAAMTGPRPLPRVLSSGPLSESQAGEPAELYLGLNPSWLRRDIRRCLGSWPCFGRCTPDDRRRPSKERWLARVDWRPQRQRKHDDLFGRLGCHYTRQSRRLSTDCFRLTSVRSRPASISCASLYAFSVNFSWLHPNVYQKFISASLCVQRRSLS